MYRIELAGEAARRAAARAAGAAAHERPEKYAAAAYLVVFVAVLAWVAIIASKLARLSRDVDELTELARRRARARSEPEQSAIEVSAGCYCGSARGARGSR